MTREEQIEKQAYIEYPSKQMNSEIVRDAFCKGAEWADDNPNERLVYTKRQLRAMGFTFDINGNISTPDCDREKWDNYVKYKQKLLINDICNWLYSNLDDYMTYREKLHYLNIFKQKMYDTLE